jgi:ATP-dependent Clp protease ATP-binding subunit ClpA
MKSKFPDVFYEAKDWLAQTGYDVTYGARPLKRVIQKYIVNPLAQEWHSHHYVITCR